MRSEKDLSFGIGLPRKFAALNIPTCTQLGVFRIDENDSDIEWNLSPLTLNKIQCLGASKATKVWLTSRCSSLLVWGWLD